MITMRRPTINAARMITAAADAVLMPVSTTRVVLHSSLDAAHHPESKKRAALLDDGFEVVSCRRRPPRDLESVVRRDDTELAVADAPPGSA